jgi:hypothetical protein
MLDIGKRGCGGCKVNMSTDTNQNYYELIKEYHKDPNQFAFFVGAGLSVPLFPTWQQLLERILSENKNSFGENEFDELLLLVKKQENLLDIAELCITKIGETRYRDILEATFDCDINKDKVSNSYKELFLLSPQVIITTNYDKIPETLSDGKYRSFTNNNSSECSRAIMGKKKIVFKLHGDISYQSSIILKRTDYQKIIFSDGNTSSLLRSLLSTRRFIFLGFSMSDPHISLLLEGLKIINNNIPISHYVFLNNPSKLNISIYENRFGIKVIPYTPENETHPEIANFLRCLNTTSGDEDIVIEPDIPNITNKESLAEYIFKELSQSYKANVSVILAGDVISVSLPSVAGTIIEFQKELLSVFKLFKFNCDETKYVHIKMYSGNNVSVDFDENQKVILIAKVKYDLIYKYSYKQISSVILWENIDFFQPPCLSDIFSPTIKLVFPFNSQIIDIQER